ncbi:hypothetical protein ACFVX6_34535 [Streptomyces sp. NPDC058289]|uniref:hypothetical protein n=1 Tax=Streptomyces sp. NPDC058289 TaxID=3346425 RepID=UPI0036EABE9A
MNKFKRTMTAVSTAVVLTAMGVVVAPAATAAPPGTPGGSSPSAVPAELRAPLAADTGAKSLESTVPTAGVYKDEDNRFIVFTGYQDANVPAPTPVRVEVRRAGTDKVVAVVDQLTFHFDNGGTSEIGSDTRWYQGDDQPLVLADMGDYELDVYAKDRDGKELSRRNAGRSTYALDARFQASSSRTEFSLDDLDAQVTGSVTAVHPRNGRRLPLAGANVRVSLGRGTTDAVSDAQGRFTTSVAALGNETSLSLTAELVSGDTGSPLTIDVRTKPQEAVLTLSTPGPLTVRYGTAVNLRGKLARRAADGTVKPVAGGHVAIQENAQGSYRAPVTAGDDGVFAYAPTILRTGSWNVSVDHIWLTGGGTRTATVTKITHTTKVVEEKLVSTTKYGKLTISGKVLVDGVTSQQAPVEIQYQESWSGRWVTAQSFVVPYNKTFTVTAGPPAYTAVPDNWRVHTPGTTNIGPSSGTRVIRQTRTKTRFSDANFTPRPVAKGQQLTITGVLQAYDPVKGYVAYPGKKVRYYFRPTPTSAYQEMGTSVSGANGAVSQKFTAQTSGQWLIRFVDADATHLTGNSYVSIVQVTG